MNVLMAEDKHVVLYKDGCFHKRVDKIEAVATGFQWSLTTGRVAHEFKIDGEIFWATGISLTFPKEDNIEICSKCGRLHFSRNAFKLIDQGFMLCGVNFNRLLVYYLGDHKFTINGRTYVLKNGQSLIKDLTVGWQYLTFNKTHKVEPYYVWWFPHSSVYPLYVPAELKKGDRYLVKSQQGFPKGHKLKNYFDTRNEAILSRVDYHLSKANHYREELC